MAKTTISVGPGGDEVHDPPGKKTKRKLPVTQAMKEAEEGEERPPSLIGIIDDLLELKTRKVPHFRPSGLYGCDRSNVFYFRQVSWHPSRQDPRMMRILDNGTAVHTVVQGYLADHPEWFFASETRGLLEVFPGVWLRGSCDGVLIKREDHNVKVGLELKTKGHEAFMALTKPDPLHVLQARIYQKLMGLKWITILYWDKDKHFLKEFPVKYSAKAWKEIKARVAFLHGFVERGELPDFNPETCSPDFCQYVDVCKKRGGKPELARKRWL